MSSIIATAQFLLGLIPNIIAIAQAIEGPGNGADKAATVTSFVVSAVESLPAGLASKLHLASIETFVGKVLATVVGFFNKVGIFKTSGSGTTAASK